LTGVHTPVLVLSAGVWTFLGGRMIGKAMIYATEIMAIVALYFHQPISQTTGIPQVPWPIQGGAILILGTLLWWQMAKTGPEEAKRRSAELDRMLAIHKETAMDTNTNIRSMTAEIKGMRDDADRHQDLWDKKFKDFPCLGLEGFKKMEDTIRKQME